MVQTLVQQGQVWPCMIPFGEVEEAKERPVVVLGWRGFSVANGDRHFLVVPSSTFNGDPTKARESDIRLADWKVAGLGEGSFIQCARLWSLAPAAFDFTQPLKGTVDSADLNAIMTEVAKLFGVTGFVGV